MNLLEYKIHYMQFIGINYQTPIVENVTPTI